MSVRSASPITCRRRARECARHLGEPELNQLERKATEESIRRQERLDLDILVDGEMYRGDMVAYFAEHLEGFRIGGLVRSYGNRYYHKPIIASQVARPKPMTVDWFSYTQSLTDRPVKGMLTGPYTMLDWSFDEPYPSRRDAALALARVVRQEVEDLQAAGAQYIQIDEPAIHARPDEIEIAIEAMGVVTQGLDAQDDHAHLLRGLRRDLPEAASSRSTSSTSRWRTTATAARALQQASVHEGDRRSGSSTCTATRPRRSKSPPKESARA